jgi:hypothetical protein
MKITIFWDITLCMSQSFGGTFSSILMSKSKSRKKSSAKEGGKQSSACLFFYPEDEGDMLL